MVISDSCDDTQLSVVRALKHKICQ